MLEICKASAGSGKTYALTGKYLKILFEKFFQGNKFPYKNILAVTFTNKATDEMKQRILHELHLISIKPEDSGYFNDLYEVFKDGASAITSSESNISSLMRDSARRILFALLNDYSSFNVSTIDRFFQQVLRSFARELGQYSSYNVELDQNSVLNQAVDAMMDSLENNKELLKWLIEMSEDAVEKGENWNVQAQVMGLASELFSEDFMIKSRNLKNVLKDKDGINNYRTKLLALARDFENRVKSLAVLGITKLENAGFTLESFPYGSNSGFSYLYKLKSGNFELPKIRFVALANNVSKWYTKSAKEPFKASVEALYVDDLNDIICELVSLMNADSSDYIDYMSAKIIVKDLFVLGVLYDVSEFINSFCKDNNVVLLSQTTGFLNKIIDGNDTPFVYEKIGTRLENYMLDEFQDTSNMQWDNFMPLLTDSIDSGFQNLIVGDVKQSIYRWRNSDWRLLNSKVKETFSNVNGSNVIENTLVTNWRSLSNVVNFNNAFFVDVTAEGTIDSLQDLYNKNMELADDSQDHSISSIYSDVFQKLPINKDEGGLVTLNFVNTKISDQPFNEMVLGALPSYIRALNARGIEDKDIALLVHKNIEGAELARFLLSEGFNVISEDSLFISSSVAVSKVIAQLKSLSSQGDDMINKFLFGDVYFEPKEKTLYNICEEAIRHLNPQEKKDVVFIQAFLDLVCDYVANNTADITGFIKWWDQSGYKAPISIPEGENALRIMTIHKSKGLGFRAVILPFFKAELYREKGHILWCTPSSVPFNDMKLVPIHTNSNLKNTIFKKDYMDEIKYSFIDSINAAYVAFTRAKEELIIFMEDRITSTDKISIKSVSDALCYKFLNYKNSPINTKGSDILSNMQIKYLDSYNSACFTEMDEQLPMNTTFCRLGSAVKSSSLEANIPVSKALSDEFYSMPINGRLRLSLKGTSFMSEDNRSKGVIMHEILSKVSTIEDLDTAVDDSVSQGTILIPEKEAILAKLKESIISVQDRGWYAQGNRTLNEISIIDAYGQSHIPDRVIFTSNSDRYDLWDNDSVLVQVIDYKFGNIHSPRYIKQVSSYISLIKQMGYVNVKGFIWYFEDGSVEEV